MGGARPHAEREDGLQAYLRICSAARKTAVPIRLQYSNGHLVKHVTRYVTHAARYVTPLMLMLFMTSNSDYIMLYGTNPGLGLQPVLSLRVRTGAAHLGLNKKYYDDDDTKFVNSRLTVFSCGELTVGMNLLGICIARDG